MISWRHILRSCGHLILLMVLSASLVEQKFRIDASKDGRECCLYFGSTLDCSHCGLKNFPSNVPANTKYLDLSYNQITQPTENDFENLTKLQKLKLNNNRMISIQGHVFSGLKDLRYLDLSSNLISILTNDVFSRLTNLQILLLNGNQIKFIEENPFRDLSSLKEMYINNTDLHCSCELIWLSKWLRHQKYRMAYKTVCHFQEVSCYNPTSQTLTKLTEDDHLNQKLNCQGAVKLNGRRRSAVNAPINDVLAATTTLPSKPSSTLSIAAEEINDDSQTNFKPEKSVSSPVSLITQIPDEFPYVVLHERAVRDVGSSSMALHQTKTSTLSESGFEITTRNETYFNSVSVMFSYTRGGGRYSILFEKTGNYLAVRQSGINLIHHNTSVAIPLGIPIDIHLAIGVDAEENITATFAYDGIAKTSTMLQCVDNNSTLCNNNNSRFSVFQSNFTDEVSNNISITIQGASSAAISVNLTILNSMVKVPELISTNNQFIATSESIVSAFKTTYKLVQATWSIFDSQNDLTYRNQSSCSSICPMNVVNTSACVDTDHCFLARNYDIASPGHYRVNVTFSNPVTPRALAWTDSFIAETRISGLKIVSCDSFANLNESQVYTASYTGSNEVINWYLDDVYMNRTSEKFDFVFTKLATFNLTVVVYNNISKSPVSRLITVLPSGSIHGLSIIRPRYYQTNKTMKIQAQLCGGKEPQLTWDLGDGTNITTNLTPINHTYSRPRTYAIRVLATNFENRTEKISTSTILQDEIKNFTATTKKSIVKVNEYFNITVALSSGTDVTFSIRQNVKPRVRMSFTGNVSKPLKIRSARALSYTVSAKNEVSRKTTTVDVSAQEEIRLALPEYYHSPLDRNIRYKANRISGSDMYVHWDYGDGSNSGWLYIDKDSPSIQHVYRNEGRYNLSLNATNNVSNYFNSSSVTIQIPLNDNDNVLTVTGSRYVATNANYRISISVERTSIYGYKISGAASFQLFNNAAYINRTFGTAKSNKLVFYASNKVSNVNRTLLVDSQDIISGNVVVMPMYLAVNTSKTLTANVQGTAPKFVWSFASGQSQKGKEVRHVFVDLGPYLINITASNGVSNVTSRVQLNIELQIQNVTVNTNASVLSIDDSVEITTSIVDRAEHKYVWIVSGQNLSQSTSKLVWKFSKVGFHTVSVNVQNHISSDRAATNIEVQEPIRGVQISIDSNYSSDFIFFNETTVFYARTNTGSNISYSWKLDPTGVEMSGSEVHITVSQPDVHYLTVGLKAFNKVSNEGASLHLPVIQRSKGVTLVSNTTTTSPNRTVRMWIVQLSGSNFSVSWFINGSLIATGESLNYKFPHVDIYNVSIAARNLAGAQNASLRIIVQDRITSPVLHPILATRNESTEFTVTIGEGTNPEYDWSLPFGVVSKQSGLPSRRWLTFQQPGIHNVVITVRNLVSSVNHSFPITIQSNITGLEIFHKQVFYQTLKPVFLRAEITVGSSVEYNWLLRGEDFSRSITNQNNISHVFSKAGAYHVIVNAANRVSRREKVVRVYIQDMATICSFDSKYGNVVPTHENVSFSAIINGTNVTVNYVVNGGVRDALQARDVLWLVPIQPGLSNITVNARNKVSNATRNFTFLMQDKLSGLSLWASSLLLSAGSTVSFKAHVSSGTNANYNWYVNHALSNANHADFERVFTKQGVFRIKVTARNSLPFKPLEKFVTVHVEKTPCPPPVVQIMGGKKREVVQSQWLYSEVMISYNCSSSSVTSAWSFKHANESTDCFAKMESLRSFSFAAEFSAVVSLGTPILGLPPRALPIGSYCMMYTAVFGRSDRYKITDAVFLKVRLDPPNPIILGGASQTIGLNQSFYLQAVSATSQFLPPNLSYQWTCIAHAHNSSGIRNNVTGCKNTTRSAENRTLVTAGSLDVTASFTFLLSVKIPGEKSQIRRKTIHVIPGRVAEVFIECITCKSYNSLEYVRSRQLKLLGKCTNCISSRAQSEVNFEWKLIEGDGRVVKRLVENSTEETSVFVINENVLDGRSVYKIVFVADVSGNSLKKGESTLSLSPNQAPTNGTCDLSPETGETLKTYFSYSCQGWKDEHNVQSPLIYWLVVINADQSSDILYRGIQSKRSFQLPIGEKNNNRELQIQILIEDTLGAVAIGLRKQIRVYPPVTNDIGTFLQNNVVSGLPLLAQEKDLNKMATVAQSTAKLLNEATNIGIREQAVVSNVTAYTSKMSASSLESIEQLSSALRMSLGVVPENSIAKSTRKDLTESLENVVRKVRFYAERGQLGSDSSLNSLFFLAQNNLAAESAASAASKRKRRAVASVSGLKANLNLVMRLYTAVLRGSLKGEVAKRFATKYGSAVLKRSSSSSLGRSLTADGCKFAVSNNPIKSPDVFEIFNTSFNNPYSELPDIASPIAGLSYSTSSGEEIPIQNLPRNETIAIQLNSTRSTTTTTSSTKIVNPNGFIEGELVLDIPVFNGSLLRVDVRVNSPLNNNVGIFLRPGIMPTDADWSYRLNQSAYEEFSRVFTPREFKSSEKYFIRIRNLDKEQALNVSIAIYTVSCHFWDRQKKIWDTFGCEPQVVSDLKVVSCKCSHLTSFASAFKIAPNPIRWSTLEDLDIEKNPIAIATCLALIILYLVSLFFANRKDDEDRREAQFIPLLGSDDYFKYEIRIKTGVYPGAGTTANVGIKLFGTKCTTKSIVLTKDSGLQRNSVDLFRFASPSRLGKITSIRVWHNNAGSNPSWYLSRIVIKNLLSGEKFFFFCNSWLAVDRGDGQIERNFSVADRKTMAQFSTIFNDVLGRTFTDYHLWISMFEKPKLSRFTRVQRVTCCVSFLLSWMCVDAMWFGTFQEGKVDFYLGFKGYSYEEVLVGVVSSLMVFPINMIFVLIFRKSRLPQSRQIYDGEEEVTIHMLPKQRLTRRMSEDWIEIEDSRPSGPSWLENSLPRCGGVPRLYSYQLMVPVEEYTQEDHLIDFDDEDSDVEQPIVDDVNSPLTHSARMSKQKTYRPASEVAVEEPVSAPKFPRYSLKQYSKIPFPSLQEVEEDRRELISEEESYHYPGPERRPVLANRFSREELDPRSSSYSERHVVMPELRSKFSLNNEYAGNQYARIEDYNDSFSSKQSSHMTSSSITRTISEPHFQAFMHRPRSEQEPSDIPEIKEFHSNLECLLPSWCTYFAYLGCLSVSVLSVVVILIYGQQFGKKKAFSWITSLFAGLFQDVFVTYPVLLVIVATLVALIRKPMNLDYSDFVMCPVRPGDSNSASEPLRGYALEIAQRQGRNKRKLRKLLKETTFQFVHLWMIFSICFTSYESHMATTTAGLKSQLDNGKTGLSSVQSIDQLWSWTENSFLSFIYQNQLDHADWVLKSVPRIRQIRVRSTPCANMPSQLVRATTNHTCKSDFETGNQETGNFMGSWNSIGFSLNNAWAYANERALNGSHFLGDFNTYPNTGYVAYMDAKTHSQAVMKIRSLKAAGWLDVKSRALFVEFAAQNFNINKFAVITILFEITASGYILPRFDVLYTKIHMYTRNLDYFRLFCEVIFGLIAVFHVWLLLRRISKHQLGLFCKFWDVHLMLVAAMSTVVVALYVYRLIVFLDTAVQIKFGIPMGYDMRHEAIIDWTIQALMGFLCFLVIMKIVKLLSLTRCYIIVGSTLRRASRHVVAQFIAFSILLCAFASWGYLAFGSQSYIFQSFWRSMVYTFLMFGWKTEDTEVLTNQSTFITWKILYTCLLIAIVIPFFKAMLCVHYREGRLEFILNRRRNHRDLTDYLFKVITRRKKPQKKRVKFSVNTSTRRSTLAASQQTISLGSDPGIPGHLSWSYSRMPRLHRERLLNRLKPRTDEILAHVYQLEQDEFLEEEFYSRLETMAKEVDLSDEQF